MTETTDRALSQRIRVLSEPWERFRHPAPGRMVLPPAARASALPLP